MPELPEVETMRRGVLSIIGSRIVGLSIPRTRYRPIEMSPDLSAMKRKANGCKVEAIRRLGKRVLVDLDSRESLVFQPKMTGLLLRGTPPTTEHVRLRVALDDPSTPEILYWDCRGLGSIHLWNEEQVEENLGSNVLGPDALDISVAELYEKLRNCSKAIKPTLLEQNRLAGIGNLYASEILHRSRIDPFAKCCELSRDQYRRIHRAMRNILLAAIEAEGSTLGDGTYRNSLSEPGSYQNQHRVYGREGELCPTCKRSPIRRAVQTQRSTFYCEVCQVPSG